MSALPNKYIPIDHSMIGLTSLLIERLGSNDTVSSLWSKVSSDPRVRTFDRFAEALSLGFAGGLVQLNDGTIQTVEDRARP
jgi:hypothetical protein